ncbi:MAG TPA: hypothetical protein VEK08_09255 [Planctomycetota bacterium]|nr:hypothetical protein [Planctomycetota bacterium]
MSKGEKPQLRGLEVDEDLQFEQRDWIVQRVAWTVMLLVAIAALLGLLGHGPLTRLTAADEKGLLTAKYYRFERAQGPSDITLNIGADALKGSEARIWVSKTFFTAVELEKVVPEPIRVESAADRLTYVFHIESKTPAAWVRFHFKPQEFWNHKVRIGLEDVTELSFQQFVWP